MRHVVRAFGVSVLALLGVILLVLPVPMSTTVQLLASYALKGAQVPVVNITSDQAISQEAVLYGGIHGVASPVTVVQYPASFPPLSAGGLSDPTWNQSVATGVSALQVATANDPAPVIFGYSEGAIVASEYKKAFNQQPVPGTVPTWVYIGNGDRPNGGILARFVGLYVPLLGLTATTATPTETAGATPGQITTYDISGQYDPMADFPTNPANLLAVANVVLGTFYVHLNYANLDPNDAILQGTYGDTAYYLIPTYPVPLLKPVEMVPIVGPIVADVLDPVVRLLVEAGYDRTISPGQPTPADFTYAPDPIALGGNLLTAISTGLDNGLADIGLPRAFGTTRPDIGPGSTGQGAYGIGGPPVTTTTSQASAPLTAPSQQISVDDQPDATPEPPKVIRTHTPSTPFTRHSAKPKPSESVTDPSEESPKNEAPQGVPKHEPESGDASTGERAVQD